MIYRIAQFFTVEKFDKFDKSLGTNSSKFLENGVIIRSRMEHRIFIMENTLYSLTFSLSYILEKQFFNFPLPKIYSSYMV